MAGLRSNRALNRGNRGAVDHDIMEGLPVRQWRKQTTVISAQPQKEETPSNTDPQYRWRELPMPRGSEMYSPWGQALLRAARRPRIPQLNAKSQEEDKDLAEEEKPLPEPDAIIETMKWTQLPREQEKPELEFLAKRRKGLPSLHEDPYTKQPMRKVKVKKVDAEGHAAVFDVLAPEGAVVEGEIVKDEAVPTEAPAPGTIVEGVGVANDEGVVVASVEPAVAPTPPRRGPPRPKRKAKGPGRGRKKRQTLSPSAAAASSANQTSDAGNGDETGADTLKVPGNHGDAASGTDVDMGEESAAKDGDDGSDDDDDDDREDASDMDGGSRSVSPQPPKMAEEVSKEDHPMPDSTAPEPAPAEATTSIAETNLPTVEASLDTTTAAAAATAAAIPQDGVPSPDLIKATEITQSVDTQAPVSTEPTSATIPAEAPMITEELPPSMDPTAPPQVALPVPDAEYPPVPPPALETILAPAPVETEPPRETAVVDPEPVAPPSLPLEPPKLDAGDAMAIDTETIAPALPPASDTSMTIPPPAAPAPETTIPAEVPPPEAPVPDLPVPDTLASEAPVEAPAPSPPPAPAPAAAPAAETAPVPSSAPAAEPAPVNSERDGEEEAAPEKAE